MKIPSRTLLSDVQSAILSNNVVNGHFFIIVVRFFHPQGPAGSPVVKRVLVVCPSSLVQNWGNEVQYRVLDNIPSTMLVEMTRSSYFS